ncbi:MAG: hypothetical protein JSU75_10935 [Gammaproteobacteria bacterium]|nr:MAG: hypothetical protein JSU75_10935 [Gammaproteobacteria bacterium]
MAEILIILAILVIIAGIIWVLRGRDIKPHDRVSHKHKGAKPVEEFADLGTKERALEKLRHSQQFWGVEIEQGGCEASIALAGKQFAFEDAPALPLPECTAHICPCQYKGLVEHRKSHRRAQEDRRDSLRFESERSDRRSLKDRRSKFDQWKGRS